MAVRQEETRLFRESPVQKPWNAPVSNPLSVIRRWLPTSFEVVLDRNTPTCPVERRCHQQVIISDHVDAARNDGVLMHRLDCWSVPPSQYESSSVMKASAVCPYLLLSVFESATGQWASRLDE